MWEEPNFTKHGDVEITKELVDLINSHDWSPPHLWELQDIHFKGTPHIYYEFSKFSRHLYSRNYNAADKKLREATQYILDYLLTLWPGYKFIKGEIAHCPPGEIQGMHIDPRVFHRLSHRVHIPLITNEHVSLKVLDDKQHLAQGEIWTFNNLKPHASENLGTTSRVHIVVDIMHPDYFNKILSKHSESYLYETTTKQEITI